LVDANNEYSHPRQHSIPQQRNHADQGVPGEGTTIRKDEATNKHPDLYQIAVATDKDMPYHSNAEVKSMQSVIASEYIEKSKPSTAVSKEKE
jgi:hypothetical protein